MLPYLPTLNKTFIKKEYDAPYCKFAEPYYIVHHGDILLGLEIFDDYNLPQEKVYITKITQSKPYCL